MFANKDAASSSAAGQSGKDVSGEVQAEKSMDKLNVREFCERFCISNGVSVQLVDGEAVSTEKSTDNISPAYVHPNMVRVLMGCSILSMLFNLDLSLLEVLFVYSIKKGKNDIYNFVASLPSLQLVTSLPNSTKGAAKGHVLVKGLWAGKDRKGKLVEWVEKASFDRLNRLFEIAANERSCETLLSAHNLRSARKALLNEREERRQEGTLQKAPSDKRSVPSPLAGAPAGKNKKVPTKGKAIKPPTPTKGVVIKSLAPTNGIVISSPTPMKGIIISSPAPSGLPSVSSDSARITGLNKSGPSMPAAERMTLLAEEATQSTRRSCPARDLKSSISGRLQDRLLETIKVSYSSAQENHPEGSEMEMAEDNPIDQVLVPDEGSLEEIQPTVNDGGPEPGRSHTLMPRQGRVPLMMQLAPLLALLAMQSWERC
ncbi:hypothetical protein CK203_107566 [Vitis vinifera]|uniref:Uncharacterized protein n=1 Tax=Vitis vinifera TaxID=29760 RepID=A0A438DC26_VITVI|nr:hypothetical protein CK203_107566 [Vitis vinifera]